MEEEIKEKWEETNAAMRQLSSALEESMIAFGKVWRDIYDSLKPTLDMFAEWFEREKRARLFGLLPLWIPDRIREWIADHWPKSWLPDLDFDDGGKGFWYMLWRRRKGDNT